MVRYTPTTKLFDLNNKQKKMPKHNALVNHNNSVTVEKENEITNVQTETIILVLEKNKMSKSVTGLTKDNIFTLGYAFPNFKHPKG